jgi:hypothetical protein
MAVLVKYRRQSLQATNVASTAQSYQTDAAVLCRTQHNLDMLTLATKSALQPCAQQLCGGLATGFPTMKHGVPFN